MAKTKFKNSYKILLPLILFLLTAVSVYWRYKSLSMIGPFTDHAFYTQWIKRLAYASHFLPLQLENDGFFSALISDEKSFLNIFLRQIYTCHQLIFTTIATLWFVFWAQLLGASMENQILISIISGSLVILILCCFPLLIFNSKKTNPPLVKICSLCFLIFLFTNTSSFLTIFSALGRHNVGVFFLIISATVNIIWIKFRAFEGPKKITAYVFICQVLAIYSSYANVFILPTATFLSVIAFTEISASSKLKFCLKYSFLTIASFLPVFFILSVVYFSGIEIPIGASLIDVGREALLDVGKNAPADSGDPNWTIPVRASYWFSFHQQVYSISGFVGGLVGLTLLALKYKISLPFFIIVCHFFTATIMSGFFLHKTAAYSLPLISLGFAYLIFWGLTQVYKSTKGKCISNLKLLTAFFFSLILPIHHLWLEFPKVTDTSKYQWGHVHYIRTDWAPIIKFLESQILPTNQFIAWDYPITNKVLSLLNTKKYPLFPLRPLSQLKMEYRKGRLKDYINTRSLKWNNNTQTYLLAPSILHKSEIEKVLLIVLGPSGFNQVGEPRAKEIARWKLYSSQKEFSVYDVFLTKHLD